MINNQHCVILNTGETNNYHQPVSAKPSVVSVSSIDSDVSDRRDVREELYAGIFRRHRKTILVLEILEQVACSEPNIFFNCFKIRDTEILVKSIYFSVFLYLSRTRILKFIYTNMHPQLLYQHTMFILNEI